MTVKPRDLILKTLKEKSVIKQDVFSQTLFVFNELKDALKELEEDLKVKTAKIDKRLVIDYIDKGEFEAHLRIAGDILIFSMHTNAFEFDKSNPIWKTSYVKNHEENSFCGMISIHNFLSDSFKYNRSKDIGYLIARIFVNRELHYFVEGKRQLGFLYNDFVNSTLNKNEIINIIESAILYSLSFDLLVPPFDDMKEVSVDEIRETSNMMQIKTGKRLGFRFLSDSDPLE